VLTRSTPASRLAASSTAAEPLRRSCLVNRISRLRALLGGGGSTRGGSHSLGSLRAAMRVVPMRSEVPRATKAVSGVECLLFSRDEGKIAGNWHRAAGQCVNPDLPIAVDRRKRGVENPSPQDGECISSRMSGLHGCMAPAGGRAADSRNLIVMIASGLPRHTIQMRKEESGEQ